MKNKETIGGVESKLTRLVPDGLYIANQKQDESTIWANFQKGNEEALIYIYRKYASILYNYGCQFTSDHEYVWDCIQDLFCELIKNRKRLGKVTSIKGYLFKSTKRKILKGLSKINKTMVVDANDQLFEVNIPYGITIDQTVSQEQNRFIENTINELPAHQREILLLYFYEGLSYQEIADIFEVKPKSIRTMTYRALEKLSVKLKTSMGETLTILATLTIKIYQ